MCHGVGITRFPWKNPLKRVEGIRIKLKAIIPHTIELIKKHILKERSWIGNLLVLKVRTKKFITMFRDIVSYSLPATISLML